MSEATAARGEGSGAPLCAGAPGPPAPDEAVTVAVVNWNGDAYLDRCLRAIRSQSRPPAAVWLVDNASTDGSVARVRRDFPEVAVLAQGENGGPAAARNRALLEATTRLVLLVDNDAVLEPSALDELHRAIRRGGGIAACQARAVFETERDLIHYDGGRLTIVGLQSLRNFRRRVADAPQGDADVAALQSVTLLVDRALLTRDDLFDEGYFFYFEDFDWSLRLRLRGKRCVAASRAVAVHLGGTRDLSWRKDRSFPARRAHYFTRNHLRLVAKCFATRTLVLAMPALVLYEAAWFLYLALRGHARSFFGGLRAFLGERREVRALRAAVQRTRAVRDRELIEPAPLSLVTASGPGGVAALASSLLSAVVGLWARCVRPLLG
jgi:GT2 family glycosyltransferase